MNYGLYKRIMKHDINAIDEIKTLDEAKDIIRMMTGNVYLHGEVYNQLSEFYAKEHLKNKPEVDIDVESNKQIKYKENANDKMTKWLNGLSRD